MAKKRTHHEDVAVISPQEVARLLQNPEEIPNLPLLQKEALWDSSSTSFARALIIMQGMEEKRLLFDIRVTSLNFRCFSHSHASGERDWCCGI